MSAALLWMLGTAGRTGLRCSGDMVLPCTSLRDAEVHSRAEKDGAVCDGCKAGGVMFSGASFVVHARCCVPPPLTVRTQRTTRGICAVRRRNRACIVGGVAGRTLFILRSTSTHLFLAELYLPTFCDIKTIKLVWITGSMFLRQVLSSMSGRAAPRQLIQCGTECFKSRDSEHECIISPTHLPALETLLDRPTFLGNECCNVTRSLLFNTHCITMQMEGQLIQCGTKTFVQMKPRQSGDLIQQAVPGMCFQLVPVMYPNLWLELKRVTKDQGKIWGKMIRDNGVFDNVQYYTPEWDTII
ncbi:hypothetical protein GGX14DRAFT_401864 [Mycena pura]|uniref:Uncharacterized protein n=1 Tax=Mycena pura TaxID=153505 RepID=A0AAD6Y601_9AGAR|nr:hypothetical protein GGX14DRAFT_401864 [Mycena pura]